MTVDRGADVEELIRDILHPVQGTTFITHLMTATFSQKRTSGSRAEDLVFLQMIYIFLNW